MTVLKIMLIWSIGNMFCYVFLSAMQHENAVDMNFEELIVMGNEQEIHENVWPIEIEKSGMYLITTAWEADSEQLLTGYKLYDSQGKVMSYCTAALWINAEMHPIYFEKGHYKLIFQYMTNEAQIREFLKETENAETEAAWYEGWPECTADTHIKGEFKMQLSGLSDFQKGYFTGALLTGVIISVLAVLILVFAKGEAPEAGAKRNYAATGLGFAAFGCTVFALQLCYDNIITGIFGADVINSPWYSWVQIIVPTYGFGFMMMLLLCKRAEKTPLEKHNMTIGQFICCIFMNTAIAGVGAIIGALVNMFVLLPSDGGGANALAELMLHSNAFWRILTVGIGAPVFEELIFRKLLIDRVHKYGEGIAVLTSGLLFGLFHGNFSQLFYATGLGLFFAYIYVRTGKIRYTIAFHMIINLSSAAVSIPLMQGTDYALLDRIVASDPQAPETKALFMQILPNLLLTAGWFILLVIFALTGLILWIVNAKKFYLVRSAEYVEREKLKTVFGNFGMIYFLLLCALLFVQYYVSAITA